MTGAQRANQDAEEAGAKPILGADGRADARWDALAMLSVAVLVALVVATFRDYGISHDEEVRQTYGDQLIAFYLSGFTDRSAFEPGGLYLFGGLFEMAARGLDQVLPWIGIYDTRHLLSGLTGVAGIAAVWRLARLLAGPRAGFLALALLALTAPWYGAMFNHTMDIPFAAAMTWLLHFSCRCVKELPAPRLASLAGIAVAGGAGLGIRAAGFLGLAYLGVALAAWLVQTARADGLARASVDGGRVVLRLLPVAVAVYVMMAVFWPWSVMSPLNPVAALKTFSNYNYQIDTLFDGEVIKMTNVPSIYLPTYFAIRLPISVLAGIVAAASFAVAHLAGRRSAPVDAGGRLALGMVVAAAAFPLLYCLAVRPYLYSGLRHFFFAMPPMIVVAALGLDRLLGAARARPRVLAAAASALAVAGVVQTAEMVALHPDQYVSYNVLVGGVPGAVGRWATDYWNNTAHEAVDAMVDAVEKEERERGGNASQVYRVAFCGDRGSIVEYLPPRFVFTRVWGEADFFISSTHIGCQENFPGAPVLFAVRRLATNLGVVLDLRKFRDGRGPALARSPTRR